MQYDVDDKLHTHIPGEGDKDRLTAAEMDGFMPPAEPSRSTE